MFLTNTIHQSGVGSAGNTAVGEQVSGTETNAAGTNEIPTPTPSAPMESPAIENDTVVPGMTAVETWSAAPDNTQQPTVQPQEQTVTETPAWEQTAQDDREATPVPETLLDIAEVTPSPETTAGVQIDVTDGNTVVVNPEPGMNWIKIGGIAVAAVLAVAVGAAVMFRLLKGNKKRKARRINVPRTAPLGEDSASAPPAHGHGGILIGNAQAIGSRQEQQDSFGISDNTPAALAEKGLLAVVADGMGGLNNGAVYSGAAVQAALRSFYEEQPERNDEATLLRVLKRAKEAVEDTGLSDGGTTFVATLIRDQKLHFISVGDSRISLMRNGGLIQLNREHVYGRELDDLATNGLLSEADAAQDSQRAALTSYLGKQSEMLIDRNISAIPLYSGDKVILMSDGVYGYMQEEYLTKLLLQKPMDAAMAVQKALMDKRKPNQDNLTIIILEIE